jgi:hypothetical protein
MPDPPTCSACARPIARRFFGLSRALTGGVCALCDRRVCPRCLSPNFLVKPRYVLEKHRRGFDPALRRERPYPVCILCFNAGAHHGYW